VSWSAFRSAEPDLARLVHTLKGSVRSLGMIRLADLALAIDRERRAGLVSAARRAELREVLELTLEQARAALDDARQAHDDGPDAVEGAWARSGAAPPTMAQERVR
jgi:HPt (histidine-containing phosphotransfer) domain-containing protein